MNRRQFLKCFAVTAAWIAVPLPFILTPPVPAAVPDWRHALLDKGVWPTIRYLDIFADEDLCNTFELDDRWRREYGGIVYDGPMRWEATKSCRLTNFEALTPDRQRVFAGTIGERGCDMVFPNASIVAGGTVSIDHFGLTLGNS